VSGRVVVVGAGVSGLAAALELLAGGVAASDLLVLEASPGTGGLLRAGEVGGVHVDLGAEAMLARRPEGVELVEQVGLSDRLVAPEPARPAVWRAGGPRPLPAGTLMGVPGTGTDLSGVLDTHEVRATVDAMAAAARRGPAATRDEDVDVARAVVADVGRPVLDLLVEPLLGGVYAGRTDQLSLAETVPALARAHRAGEPLAVAVDRAGAAATPGAPVFTGLDGGMAGIARAATVHLQRAGVDVRCGVRVTGLERTASGWSVRTHRRDAASGPDLEGRLDATLVLLAVPTTTTARLLTGPLPEAASELGRTPVAGVAVVALALRGLEPTTSGLLVPPVESSRAGLAVKAVTFSSTKWAWVAGQDRDVTVLRASVGRVGETAALQRDDDDLVDLVRRDLTVMLGPEHAPALTAADSVVARWGGALPQYTPGHALRREGLQRAVAGAGGLAVTGGFVEGVGVPACIASARRAARGLLSG
jgi:protoporphyrinogen/coproporphyrinogen III oxidase